MRQDYLQLAIELDQIAEGFKHLAKVFRGEVIDHTGIGAWRILCNQLGQTMDVSVITKDQYEDYKKLSDEDYKRRGGQTSY
jgi:hypothetical protein